MKDPWYYRDWCHYLWFELSQNDLLIKINYLTVWGYMAYKMQCNKNWNLKKNYSVMLKMNHDLKSLIFRPKFHPVEMLTWKLFSIDIFFKFAKNCGEKNVDFFRWIEKIAFYAIKAALCFWRESELRKKVKITLFMRQLYLFAQLLTLIRL